MHHQQLINGPMKVPASYRRLRTVQLVAVIFFTVSGGPYGLEPLLTYAGDGALLLLLVTPLVWDVPTILTVLELNSMMPLTGGYYQWVKKALGMRWGFFEGWWTWLYTFVDLAIYPVMFVGYAAFFFPQIEAIKIPLCLSIIWACAGLNILGIVSVGRAAQLLSIAVLLPFVIVFVLAFSHFSGAVPIPHPSLRGISLPNFGMALYTIMWNFIGWDSSTTYAGEVEKPVRSYLISTIAAFVLVLAIYTLAILAAQRAGIDRGLFGKDGFPALGLLVGGRWLGSLFALGGMASSLGLFCAVLLSVSRVPEVMAEDRLLPRKLSTLHARFKTPYVSIIVCALIVSFMILWTFGELVIIDITVYGAGLLLEFIALLYLRRKLPDEHRPFRIPLGTAGLCMMIIFPFAVYFLALSGAFLSSGKMIRPALFAIGLLLTAEIGWQFAKRRRRMTVDR
jgi:amino acid transporter